MREWSAASDTEKSSRMRLVFHISMGRNRVSGHNERELYFKEVAWNLQ